MRPHRIKREVESFLKEAQAFLPYDEADLEHDLAAQIKMGL